MHGETPAFVYTTVTEGRGETLALGQHLYDDNCQTCHGLDGTGEVLGAADLFDFRFVDDQAPQDFYLITTQGKGSMPA